MAFVPVPPLFFSFQPVTVNLFDLSLCKSLRGLKASLLDCAGNVAVVAGRAAGFFSFSLCLLHDDDNQVLIPRPPVLSCREAKRSFSLLRVVLVPRPPPPPSGHLGSRSSRRRLGSSQGRDWTASSRFSTVIPAATTWWSLVLTATKVWQRESRLHVYPSSFAALSRDARCDVLTNTFVFPSITRVALFGFPAPTNEKTQHQNHRFLTHTCSTLLHMLHFSQVPSF